MNRVLILSLNLHANIANFANIKIYIYYCKGLVSKLIINIK